MSKIAVQRAAWDEGWADQPPRDGMNQKVHHQARNQRWQQVVMDNKEDGQHHQPERQPRHP